MAGLNGRDLNTKRAESVEKQFCKLFFSEQVRKRVLKAESFGRRAVKTLKAAVSLLLRHVGTDCASFRFLFAQKSVTCAVVPPFSQKVTLGLPVRL